MSRGLDRGVPILELDRACPVFDERGLISTEFSFRLMPGECALIETRETFRAALFADLCTGMSPLASGVARCMGLDWTELGEREVWALRGRVGRIATKGAWVDLFGTHMNIMMPQLHHTRTSTARIVDEAQRLGQRFGLPGLPVLPPTRLSAMDLRRASCVRAFLGEPSLLLLEEPVHEQPLDLYQAFLEVMTNARDRGAAVIWFASDPAVWRGYCGATTRRLRLIEEGLFSMKGEPCSD